MNNKNLTILFSSFGDYQDLLPITYYFFNKFWKSCPYEIYWGSNGTHIEKFDLMAPKWKYICESTEDLGWSRNLKSYLAKINSEYVLLLLDDFLLLKEPNIYLIEKGLNLLKEMDGVYLRLNTNPPADKKIDDIFGIIHYYSDYRSSLQPSIWKKDILLKLCDYDFNPWLFEWKAGIVKETINKVFLGVFEDVIFVSHCIEKGKWIEDRYNLILSENLKINNKRGIYHNNIENYDYKLSMSNKIINKFPKKMQFHLRKLLKKGIFSNNFKGYSHKYGSKNI